jgi:AbiU2
MATNREPFTQKDRVRRAAILCIHFLRNLAYYRAGWAVHVEQSGSSGASHRILRRKESQFWRTVNGNCLDTCILEWCKLFADRNGKHNWRKVVADPTAFLPGVLAHLRMTEADLRAYTDEIRGYRNKFVAHLDELHVMNIPLLRAAGRSVAYLYTDLIGAPGTKQYLPDARLSAGRYYALFANEGRCIYSHDMEQ